MAGNNGFTKRKGDVEYDNKLKEFNDMNLTYKKRYIFDYFIQFDLNQIDGNYFIENSCLQ